MKKFILFVLLMFVGNNLCFATNTSFDKDMRNQRKVMEVGFRILNANQIDKRVTFVYLNKDKLHTSCKKVIKRVVIYDDVFDVIDSDSELAALISHNISIAVDSYGNPFKRMGVSILTKKYAKKADKRAVEYMVNAGYNPVALIVVYNKYLYEPNWYDFGNVNTKGSKIMLSIYEHILNNYPQYLVDNEYESNIYYQNFLITTHKEREKIGLKYKNKNTAKQK